MCCNFQGFRTKTFGRQKNHQNEEAHEVRKRELAVTAIEKALRDQEGDFEKAKKLILEAATKGDRQVCTTYHTFDSVSNARYVYEQFCREEETVSAKIVHVAEDICPAHWDNGVDTPAYQSIKFTW